MNEDLLSTYVIAESTERVIGFDNSLIVPFILQIISTVVVIEIFVLIIYLCVLTIKALKIYIKKNS